MQEELYEDSGITVDELLTKILEFYFENSMSKIALNQLINLLNFSLPHPKKLPKTEYHFLKLINKFNLDF